MALKPRMHRSIWAIAVVAVIGIYLSAASPYVLADAVYSTSGYAEVRSHWDSTKNKDAYGTGTTSVLWNYASADGLFSAFAQAEAGPGQMNLAGSFYESYPSGTNVALVDGAGNYMWLNTALGVQAELRDKIRVVGPSDYYDVTFPVHVDGTFSKGGTANCTGSGCENQYGIQGEFELYAIIRSVDGSTYSSGKRLVVNEDQFTPGIYYVSFQGIPSGIDLNFRFRSWTGFNLTDTIDYTDQLYSDLGFGWLDDPSLIEVSESISQRAGDYVAWGFADFSNTVSFGSFIAYSNGIVQSDVTITSLNANGMTFTATIPEPTSLILLGTGLGLIGLAWRRTRR